MKLVLSDEAQTELDVLQAIYGAGTSPGVSLSSDLQREIENESSESCRYDDAAREWVITFLLPPHASLSTTTGEEEQEGRSALWVRYPSDAYPATSPPVCRLTWPDLTEAMQRELEEDAARLDADWLPAPLANRVQKIWEEEQHGVILFRVIDELKPSLAASWHDYRTKQHQQRAKQTAALSQTTAMRGGESWPFPMFVSEPVIDRKSTFIGFVTAFPQCSELAWLLRDVLPRQMPKVNSATHCMYAYQTAGGATEHDDGGESGAGMRIARFLQFQTDATDTKPALSKGCIIVVYRWYGGVHLGADRWKHISTCAKQAFAQFSSAASKN